LAALAVIIITVIGTFYSQVALFWRSLTQTPTLWLWLTDLAAKEQTKWSRNPRTPDIRVVATLKVRRVERKAANKNQNQT